MSTPARYWREKPQRYRLEAGKCKKCGKLFLPPRQICNECGGRAFAIERLAEEGKIVSWTVVHTGHPAFTDEVPYALAIVELSGGPRLLMQLADYHGQELRIGQKVEVKFRKLQAAGESGVLSYGYKAALCSE
jgi:uncharacterized OB-fold protein